MSHTRKTARERMSEWVLHCAVNQRRHIRRSQPTREAALHDACAQLLQGHAVNRIKGGELPQCLALKAVGARGKRTRPVRCSSSARNLSTALRIESSVGGLSRECQQRTNHFSVD